MKKIFSVSILTLCLILAVDVMADPPLNSGLTTGACCYDFEGTMMCVVTDDQGYCEEGLMGTFHADATCDDVDPEDGVADICAVTVEGACCYMDGPVQMCLVTDDLAYCFEELMGTSFNLGATCEDIDPEDGVADICATGPEENACCYMDGSVQMCLVTDDEAYCVEELMGTFHMGANCEDVDPPDGVADICGVGPERGACCFEGTLCEVTTEVECAGLMGTFHAGATCEDVDPEDGVADICAAGPERGACCFEGTLCEVITEEECAGLMGTFHAGATCEDVDPPDGVADICAVTVEGACCYMDGSVQMCVVTDDQAYCFGELMGTSFHAGATCEDVDPSDGVADICAAPEEGACCYDFEGTMMCVVTDDQDYCFGELMGASFHAGATCEDFDPEDGVADICVVPAYGACCYNLEGTIMCMETDQVNCFEELMGTSFHLGATCDDFDPSDGVADICAAPEEGACCYDFEGTMMCVVTDDQDYCFGELMGTSFHTGATCEDFDPEDGVADVCVVPEYGACCYDFEGTIMCMETDQVNCFGELMGTSFHAGATCDDFDPEDGVADICEQPSTYEYLPGDANMAAGSWPPNVIGADVTYLVNYFRAIAAPCLVGGFYNSADANGDCSVIGADVTYLVQYFRGANELHYCPDYEPSWSGSGDLPAEAPDGWPNCE